MKSGPNPPPCYRFSLLTASPPHVYKIILIPLFYDGGGGGGRGSHYENIFHHFLLRLSLKQIKLLFLKAESLTLSKYTPTNLPWANKKINKVKPV